jgi:uncharacterized protein (TIGR03382 family)
MSLLVPTNLPIDLDFAFVTGTYCIGVPGCDLMADASHSDYIEVSLADGYTFTSASGYHYLGKPDATGEVPLPATLPLLGLGMLGMLAARRRMVAQQRSLVPLDEGGREARLLFFRRQTWATFAYTQCSIHSLALLIQADEAFL